MKEKPVFHHSNSNSRWIIFRIYRLCCLLSITILLYFKEGIWCGALRIKDDAFRGIVTRIFYRRIEYYYDDGCMNKWFVVVKSSLMPVGLDRGVGNYLGSPWSTLVNGWNHYRRPLWWHCRSETKNEGLVNNWIYG